MVVTVTKCPGEKTEVPIIVCYCRTNNGWLEENNITATNGRNNSIKKVTTVRMKSVFELNLVGNWSKDPGMVFNCFNPDHN